jgi:hypothetical protein
VKILGVITDLIPRYRVREEVFRSVTNGTTESQKSKMLREKFVKKTTEMYSEILEVQILLACTFARSSFLQYFRNVAKYDEWEKLTKKLVDLDNEIKDDVKDLDAKRNADMEATLERQERALQELVSKLKDQARLAHDEEKIDCLKALSSSLDYETCKNQISARVPGKNNSYGCDTHEYLSFR